MKQFETVAELKLSQLTAGQIVTTKGYYTAGDGGSGSYLIKAAQAVDGYRDHTLANGEVAIRQSSGVDSLYDFGAMPAASDLQARIQTALSSGAGSLKIPAGTYPISLSASGNVFSIASPINVYGEPGAELVIDYDAGFSGFVFNINSSDVDFIGIKIDLNADSGGAVCINIQDGNNINIKDNTLTGTRSWDGSKWFPHGIKCSDAADCDNVVIDGNEIYNVNFLLFTANGFGTTGNRATNWRVTNNYFHECSSGVTFNSDFATAGADTPWRGVSYSSNNHYRVEGKVGGDGMADLAIIGNSFLESLTIDTECAFHWENLGNNINITGNTIDCTTGGGIKVYPLTSNYVICGNTIDGPYARNPAALNPSTLNDPVSENIGIWLVNDTDGKPENVSVTGNTIRNCDRGIHISELNNCAVVAANTIEMCNSALWIRAGGRYVENNTAILCKYLYEIGDCRGIVGVNNAFDTAFLFYDKTDTFALEGLRWGLSESASISAGVTGTVELFGAPDRSQANSSMAITRTGATSNHCFAESDFFINDSSVLTATRNISATAGSLTIAGTTFSTGSKLEARIFNGYGTSETVQLEASFNGMMIWI